MKITLINPPSPYLENDAAYPPMGLMYLANAFLDNQCEVDIVDLTGGQELPQINSDIVGITAVTANIPIVNDLFRKTKGIKIVGGPHCTAYPHLEDFECDSLVSGEGETVVTQLLSDIQNHSLKPVYLAGLADLNTIKKPNRSLVNLHRYLPGKRKCTTIQTSRGCPFQCHFCPRVGGKTHRTFPLGHVIEEIQDVIRLGFDEIAIGDDNIAIDLHRLSQLLDELAKLKIKFRLNIDARHLNEEMFKQAAASGCVMISYGIESGSQKMLDLMRKDVTVEKNMQAIQWTLKYGMHPRGYLVINFPGEDDGTIDETVQFMRASGCNSWLTSSFVPLPGTEPFDHPERYGITWISKDWSQFYLVDKNQRAGKCFLTKHLTFEQQEVYRSAIGKFG